MAYRNWMPPSTAGLLKMADAWEPLITTVGLEKWDVKEEFVVKFQKSLAAAKREDIIPKSIRTPVTYAHLKATLDMLRADMRFIKKRYLHEPPLTTADFRALLLKPSDAIATPVNVPDAAPIGELRIWSDGFIEVRHIRNASEITDVRSGYGTKIHVGVLARNGDSKSKASGISERPKHGEDLPFSVFTRKKSYRFDFSKESGNEAFFCLRYENSKGEAGPWGRMMRAFVP